MKSFQKCLVNRLLIAAVCAAPLLGCSCIAAEPATSVETASLKMPQALAAAGFKRFSALIEAAGLTKSLESEGPFTCFAPTDAAFEGMPAAKKQFFQENPKDETVIRWIQYHFIEGLAMDRDMLVAKVSGAHTMDKRYLRVWVTPGQISINKTSPLVITDIKAANGIIHGVSVQFEPPDTEQEILAKP